MQSKHLIKDIYTEECSCKKCDVYAEITEFHCGCVDVQIFNESTKSDKCIDFSVNRYIATVCCEKIKSEKKKIKRKSEAMH